MNESTATRYQRLRRTAQLARLSVGAAWLSLVVFTPVGRWIAVWAEAVGGGWAFLLFATVLVLIWEAVALPVGLYAAVRTDRRFRRGGASPAAVFTTQFREAQTGILIAVAGASMLWLSLTTLGAWWWLAAGVLGAPLLVAATALAGVTARTAAGSRPLLRQDLIDRLTDLAERTCGRRVPVLEWTDPAAEGPTALVTGVGATGAILISREMVADWNDAEIAVVVAHELSHHARHDLWRKAGLDAAVLLLALWTAHVATMSLGPRLGVRGLTDLMALPLISLIAWVMWWILRPIRLAQSRAHEREADRFAIARTGDPEAFRAAVRRLAAQHLAEERPSVLTRWLFHRHPTVQERLNAAGKQ